MTKFIGKTYGADFEHDTVRGYMVSNWATSIADSAPQTRQLYNLTARKYLGFLYEMQYISFDLRNALPKLPSLEKQYEIHPEKRPDKQAYTKEQVKAMLDFQCRSKLATLRNRAMIATLVSTGLRVSEMLSLNIGDVLLTDGTAMIPRKGTHGHKVKVFIPTELHPEIMKYLLERENKNEKMTPDSPLFATSKGRRMTAKEVYAALSFIEKSLGYPTGVHTFRHTALSEISRIADPATARDIAGQKRIEVTNRYLHSTNAEKQTVTSQLTKIFLSA
ncbi:MAG: site-specific integrase [Clostridiales bacterium]|nr:site-specific integrase [Clostridiales bacterium]